MSNLEVYKKKVQIMKIVSLLQLPPRFRLLVATSPIGGTDFGTIYKDDHKQKCRWKVIAMDNGGLG